MVLITIGRTTRQGTFISPSVVIPAGIAELIVRLNVTNATYAAVGKSVTMRLYYLDEAQGLWRMTSSATWQTGAYTDQETGEVNPVPVLSPSIVGLTGKTVRAEFEIPVSMSVGASIETLP